MVNGVLLGLRLAKRHLRIVRLVHLHEEEDHHADEQQHGQEAQQRVEQAVGQLHRILDVRILRKQLHERVLAHIGGGVVAQLAQGLGLKRLGFHARIGAKSRLHLSIQRFKCLVVGIRRRRARRGSGIVLAGHGIASGVVNHVFNAALLHRLHELRRNQRIGLLGAPHQIHHLAADEERDEEEQHGGHDAHALRRARTQLFGILGTIRIAAHGKQRAEALGLIALAVRALPPTGRLVRSLPVISRLLRLGRLRRRRLRRLGPAVAVVGIGRGIAHYLPWYTSGFSTPI